MTIRAVFFGSSNVTGATANWPYRLCQSRGWTMHNFAVGGAAYTGSNTFAAQLTKANQDMDVAEKQEVTHVFVGDASNNARAKTSYDSVRSAAASLFFNIRNVFPNAKIVVLPMIWPADAGKYTPNGFSYDPQWNAWAILMSEAQKDALENYSNVLYIDESWTWLTGRDDLMISAGDVHPNSTGHLLIAGIVDRILDGERYTSTSAWELVVPKAGYEHGATSWGRPLSVIRRGWNVSIEGAMRSTGPWSSYADFGVVPYGFRPTYIVPLFANLQGSRDHAELEMYPNGTIRLVGSGSTGGGFYTFTSYRIG